jgi:hypothetical protein
MSRLSRRLNQSVERTGGSLCALESLTSIVGFVGAHMTELTKAEKRILETAGQPPKRLRDFLPFVLPSAVVAVLLVVHGVLFWYTARFGEQGLYIHDGRHYVEVLEDVRGFILGTSFLIVFCFGITCGLSSSLWHHKKALHEVWRSTR